MMIQPGLRVLVTGGASGIGWAIAIALQLRRMVGPSDVAAMAQFLCSLGVCGNVEVLR